MYFILGLVLLSLSVAKLLSSRGPRWLWRGGLRALTFHRVCLPERKSIAHRVHPSLIERE